MYLKLYKFVIFVDMLNFSMFLNISKISAIEAKFDAFLCLYHHHHHHHLFIPPARISLALSRHSSLLFIAPGRSSGLHHVSLQSCCM